MSGELTARNHMNAREDNQVDDMRRREHL
jgi:hypothetical protein